MKNHEKRAAARTDGGSYAATVESLEPDIYPIDDGAFYASAAISLKRIADVAELMAVTLIKNHGEQEKDMRSWAHRHGFGDLWDTTHE